MSKLALVLICAVPFAAGCGEEESSEPAQQPSGSGAGDSSGGGTRVSMKDIQFKPATITVKKGGTVTWTNDDMVGHDVTKEAGPGADFKSGEPGGMQSGDTFQQRFTTPGTVQYVCRVHPGMEGTVAVK